MKIHCFRLMPSDLLKESIEVFVKNNVIKAGVVLSCVGSLQETHLRFANQREGTVITGKQEILSLNGTLSPDGLHLHLAVSDAEGVVRGGHLLNGCIVFTTVELVIGEIENINFKRVLDEKTGFKELIFT